MRAVAIQANKPIMTTTMTKMPITWPKAFIIGSRNK